MSERIICAFEGIEYEVGKIHVNIAINESLKDKQKCLALALSLINEGQIKLMSQKQIAAEIYAHIWCYYNYLEHQDFLHHNAFTKFLYQHAADGIWVNSGGDLPLRRLFYKLVWLCK